MIRQTPLRSVNVICPYFMASYPKTGQGEQYVGRRVEFLFVLLPFEPEPHEEDGDDYSNGDGQSLWRYVLERSITETGNVNPRIRVGRRVPRRVVDGHLLPTAWALRL